MLKAIFLDLDETLCATSQANDKALIKLRERLAKSCSALDGEIFSQRYIDGIHKRLNEEFPEIITFLPDEMLFRSHLIKTLFAEQKIEITYEQAQSLQIYFEDQRMANFSFFPNIKDTLIALRKKYQLVVITNGPVFSQRPKIEAVSLADYVDHIIVGGEEPEEKPHVSIYKKAMRLAGCEASEAVHIGDSLSADIAGAKASGVGSVWVNSFVKDDISKAREMQVDYILDDPSELDKAIAFFE